jgi:hypothetical protein
MSGHPEGMPWSKFWWKDYNNDAALRRCSLEAEGLWMRLLCVMAEAEPYGYLLVEGTVPDNGEIARIVGRGLTERRVAKLMGELLLRRVYSLDDRGIPFCRRMVREAKNRADAKIYGARGGNPALKKGANRPRDAEKSTENNENTDAPFGTNASGINDLVSAEVNPHANPPDKLLEERGFKEGTGSLRSPATTAVAATVTASQTSALPEQSASATVVRHPSADRAEPADPFGADLLGPIDAKPAKRGKAKKAEPENDGAPVPRTPRRVLTDVGIPAFAEMAGVKRSSLEDFVIMVLRDHAGWDAALVLKAIMPAHAHFLSTGDAPINVRSWLIAEVKKLKAASAPQASEIPAEINGWIVKEVLDHCADLMRVVDPEAVWPGFSAAIVKALQGGAEADSDIYPVMSDVGRQGSRTIQTAGYFTFAIAKRRRAVA